MTKDFKKLTEAEYRAYPAESYSSIKYLLESPQTYLYYRGKPFQGSDSTLLGTCVHHYLQRNRHLVAFNRIKRTSKERKVEYAEFERIFKEQIGEEGLLVPESFEEKINTIMTNFNNNQKAITLLNDCSFEEPFLFEYNGVPLKGKPDGLKSDFVVEIKTSSGAFTAAEFRREAYARDYDLQAFLYLQATGKKKHWFIVANTIAPYSVNRYPSSEEFIENGRDKAIKVTERYKKHILNGEPFDDSENEEAI